MRREYTAKDVAIGERSRNRVKWMRRLLVPLVRLLTWLPHSFSVRFQLRLAGHLPAQCKGLDVDYDIFGTAPAMTLGRVTGGAQRVVLYLHGGGFLLPAMPKAHLAFHATLCNELDAVGVMPDYRLGPLHQFPAALDDCESVYRSLLDQGVAADQIVLAGESAGGNLLLGLLQRIRSAKLPMPCCAVPISAVTEMARVYAPPSRSDNLKKDAMLPVLSFPRMVDGYVAGADGANPELSPIFADYAGFPPLYFIVGEDEVLLDDSLIAHRQATRAGVESKVDVWPVLPHAFPLLRVWFPEARQAAQDIVDFAREHLAATP